MSTSRTSAASIDILALVQDILFRGKNGEALLRATNSDNLEDAISKLLLKVDEIQFQLYMAPLLRAATTQHLRSGQTKQIKDIRREYNRIYHAGGFNVSFENYVAHKAKKFVWTTEIEAAALGDLFNVTVEIIEIHRKKKAAYNVNQSTNVLAPAICIYNYSNQHYFIDPQDPGQTYADGNCMYNAFALALRQCALYQKATQQLAQATTTMSPKTKRIYENQEELKQEVKETKQRPIKKMLTVLSKKDADEAKHEETPAAIKKPSLREAAFIPFSKFDPIPNKFFNALAIMAEKTQELEIKSQKNPNYKIAADKARRLLNKLSEVSDLYFNKGKIDVDEFIRHASSEIQKARPVLETHRGWTQVLGNLALVIVGMGIGFVVAALINKAVTGNYLFFKTDSSAKLNKLEKAVKAQRRKKH